MPFSHSSKRNLKTMIFKNASNRILLLLPLKSNSLLYYIFQEFRPIHDICCCCCLGNNTLQGLLEPGRGRQDLLVNVVDKGRQIFFTPNVQIFPNGDHTFTKLKTKVNITFKFVTMYSKIV